MYTHPFLAEQSVSHPSKRRDYYGVVQGVIGSDEGIILSSFSSCVIISHQQWVICPLIL